MNQIEFNRRKRMAAAARARESLKLWAPAVAMVGAQDWFDMGAQAGIAINAMTDNGGGMGMPSPRKAPSPNAMFRDFPTGQISCRRLRVE